MFRNDANQTFNLLYEVFGGWKNRGHIKTALLFVAHTAPTILLSYVITKGVAALPKVGGDGPDDPKDVWQGFKKWFWDTLKMWWGDREDAIDEVPGALLGGIPVVGDIAEVATRAGTNQIRKARGREPQKWFGDVGTSPIQGLGGDIEDIVAGLSEGKEIGEKALETYLRTTGVGGYVPYKRIKGTIGSGDLRRVGWSEYALRDKSVEAAMAKRAAKKTISNPEEIEWFAEWYEDLGKEKWYDRDTGGDKATTAGKARQERFVRYYNQTLDRIADEDPERGFRLMKASGLFSKGGGAPPNQFLRDWAAGRRDDVWTDDDFDRYWDWVRDGGERRIEKRGRPRDASDRLGEAAGR